jgi:hypothetical protein
MQEPSQMHRYDRVTPVVAGGGPVTAGPGGLIWVYLLGTSVQNTFGDLLSVSSWLTIGFYLLTALALMAYYRRRIFTSGRDAVTLGLLPLGAAAFLGWVLVRSFAAAIPSQKWSLAAVLAVGVVLMLLARFVWRSPFFRLTREATGPHGSTTAWA